MGWKDTVVIRVGWDVVLYLVGRGKISSHMTVGWGGMTCLKLFGYLGVR